MTTPTIELKPSSHLLADAEREAILAAPGFGRHFTDHMVTIKWTEGRGWHDAQLVPYAPLSIDPANMTLHYAQTIFEGLKAYRQPDGSVATFRPEANARALPVLRPAAGDARAAGRDLHRGVRRAGRAGHGVGAQPGRGVALPAAVHDRHRGRARRAPGQRVPLPGHRLPGRRVLPRRRAAGLGLALRGVRAGGPRRHRRGQDRRQLRRLPRRPGPGQRARLRPGGLAGRDRAPLDRGDGRHEPVLRVRRPGSSPPSCPAPCCPASPGTRC